jgi:sensor histidine kinase YesM
VSLSIVGLLLAPWAALAALVRQKDALARHLSLTIEMERHAFERQALEARMRLLQAQVEPHFLFNTLANVRELVDTGSARASAVLNSLIAYLRAAVPKIHETSTAMRDELELVGAYLEVMQMRMPDRLEYGLHAEPQAQRVQCPPLTLLTLVENAVRHGIDPAEQPGRIDVRVAVKQGRCHAEVVDTGVGLGAGTGTGLANLMERMQLAFGAEVELQLHPVEPHGVHAELVFPAVLEAR